MMSNAARQTTPSATLPLSSEEQLRAAKEILRLEATALWKLSNDLQDTLTEAVETIYRSKGSVIVTGMGKAGLIGQKITATLASTGTRAHFMHPAEAFHGDLGRIDSSDVVLALSQSGETGEMTQLLPSLAEIGVSIISIVASGDCTLAKASEVVIELGDLDEACSLGLAPSTSTTAMLAVGDAVALVLSKMRGFTAEDFARFHPGGSLGRKLSRVDDCMRPIDECRVAAETATIREVLVACSKPGRRTGAIMLVDGEGKLAGLFTDSDLARQFESSDDASLAKTLSQSVGELMVRSPTTVPLGCRMQQAVTLLAGKKISELPVVNEAGKPVGLVDVTDIVGWQPEDEPQTAEKPAPVIRVFPDEDVYAAG